MNLEDVVLNNELTVGGDCYYDHGKYTYKGVTDEGKYIISRKLIDEEITKYIEKPPHVPSLPLGLYFKNKRTGKVGEITDYNSMLGQMHYRLTLYDDVFKGYDLETLDDLKSKWELLEENPFTDDLDQLIEDIEGVNDDIRQYEKQIEDIKKNYIEPLEEKRKLLYKQCKHDWHKYDEEHVSGNSYKQECVCQICGEEKINRFSRWG